MLSLSNIKARSKDSIYLLVDKVNIAKDQRKVNIRQKGVFLVYEFSCPTRRIHNEHEAKITSLYINGKDLPKPLITDSKPNYNYISYDDLLDIIHKTGLYFNNNYLLFITQVLLGGYKTVKTYLEFPVKTVVN